MDTFLQDIKFGARTLRRNQGVTAVAIVALALGIGGNSAIFSVVNAVLLRPLPYPEPERIMRVFASAPERGLAQTNTSLREVKAITEQNQVFERVGAYTVDSANLTGIDEPLQLTVTRMSAGVLEVLNLKPALGRNFIPEEDTEGGQRVVILSNAVWRRQFGGSTDVIGKSVNIDTASYTVVGVMADGFNFPGGQIDAWVPRIFEPSFLNRDSVERGAGYLNVIARLKPGVTRQQAQFDVDSIASHNDGGGQLNLRLGLLAIPLSEVVTQGVKQTLYILLGAVGFVLLIACANVANLLLAKAAGRQKEIAVRAALGARRIRLIRQFLTESVLLALISAGLGIALASWGVDLIVSATSGNIPRSSEISVDLRVLMFTLGVALVTGVIFGLAPALQASRTELNETLKDTSRGMAGGTRRARIRNLLVVAEVALSVVLLIGAGLLMRSFFQLQRVDAGFNPDHLLIASINLPPARYNEPTQRASFYRRLHDELSALPGVVSVGAGQTLPLAGGDAKTPIAIDGRAVPPLPERPIVSINIVSPEYFKALGIPLLQGRFFSEQDNETAPIALIINQSFAKKFFPDEDPIGKRVLMGGTQNQPREIVGMVGDVRQIGLDTTPGEGFYISSYQRPQLAMSIVLRTETPPLSLGPALRSKLHAIDRDQPIASLESMDTYISQSISDRRFTLMLLGLFASVALILAAIGIYSVMAYTVTQRTGEIGLRMALGAQTGDVLKLVVGQGMRMASIGIGVGLASAFALTRVMTSLLFNISTTDPITFVGIPAILAVVALAACLVPARRAVNVDPMVALRYE